MLWSAGLSVAVVKSRRLRSPVTSKRTRTAESAIEPILMTEPQIIITLAGNEAQGRFDPASRDRSGGDYDKIKAIMANRDARLARSLVSPKTNPFAGLWACADLSEDELEELADDFFGDQDCEPLDLDSCQRECGRLVRDNALLEHETLSGEEIEDLLS